MSEELKACPFCHREDVFLSVPISAELSHTDNTYWKNVGVDSCIALMVQALNDAEIYTVGCCCGHGKRDGSIILQDGRTIIIKTRIDPLIKNWRNK